MHRNQAAYSASIGTTSLKLTYLIHEYSVLINQLKYFRVCGFEKFTDVDRATTFKYIKMYDCNSSSVSKKQATLIFDTLQSTDMIDRIITRIGPSKT